MTPADAELGGVARDAVAALGLLALPLGAAAWLLAPVWATLRTRSLEADARALWQARSPAAPPPSSRSPYREAGDDPHAVSPPSGLLRLAGVLGLWSGHLGVAWLPAGVALLPFSWSLALLAVVGVGFFALLAASSESLLRGGRLALDEAAWGSFGLLGYCLLALPFASSFLPHASIEAQAPTLSRIIVACFVAALASGAVSGLMVVVACFLPRSVLPSGIDPHASAPPWKQRLLALGLVMVGCSVAYRTVFVDRPDLTQNERPRVMLKEVWVR